MLFGAESRLSFITVASLVSYLFINEIVLIKDIFIEKKLLIVF